jgi:rubrerythrin
MESGTRKNLEAAMKGEALAFGRYMLFAERAREEGHAEIADLLERVAREERLEHFREFAELYGLVGDTEENLQTAVDGESEEVSSIYLKFAQEARAAGDTLVADRFEEVRMDEMKHEAFFRDELARLKASLPEEEIAIHNELAKLNGAA